MNILDLPKTEKTAVAFLQERGILQRKRKCKMDHDMKLTLNDRPYWHCRRRSCNLKISMRVGNWFEGSRMSFVTAIRFIYGWAHEQTSLNWCDSVLNMDKGTAVAWNGYMREVAAKALEKSSSQSSNMSKRDHSVNNKIGIEPEETATTNTSVTVNCSGNAVLTENPLTNEIKAEPEETLFSESTVSVNINKTASLIENPLAIEIKVEPEETVFSDSSATANVNENAELIEMTFTKEMKIEPGETELSDSAVSENAELIDDPTTKEMNIESQEGNSIATNSASVEYPPAKRMKVEPEETTLDVKPSFNIIDGATSSSETASNRKIGGDGKTVEVYESQFSNYKNKYGRVFTPQWIIGGLCRETKECFLVRVLEPTAHTLLTTIEDKVQEGSTICTDKWCGYDVKELEDAGLDDLREKYHFIHSSSSNLTKNAQSLWGSAKCRSKKQRGIRRKNMDSYLTEFMWRTQLGDKDPFDAILDAISEHWPPEIYSRQWHR